MSIALIGITGIQIYWINNAIDLKEATFKRNVNEAITNVVYKLEKLEVAAKIREKMYASKQGSNLFHAIDSINNIFFKELEKNRKDTGNYPENVINFTSEKITVQVLQDQSGEIIKRYDTNIITIQTKDKEKQPLVIKEQSTIPLIHDTAFYKDIDSVQDQLSRYIKKSFLIRDVLEDIFNLKHYKAIENRLNFIMLDSLINEELEKKGIYTPYEFGVYSPLRNLMIIETKSECRKELLESGFAYNLFPRDLFIAPEYLLIYFPAQKKYLLQQLWKMLLISTLLLMAIVFSFVYNVIIIFKQKKLSEMKNDFINNMTHEIRTPITTIAMACETLKDNSIPKNEVFIDNYINIINEENKRLSSLSEKILQTAIIEKGKLKLKKELVNIHELIPEIVDRIRFQVERRSGVINMYLKAEKFIINVDKVHITNVIYNLLDNANKYTPSNNAIIEVATYNNEKGIFITVADNGIGISKSNQKKIFDTLYRVSTGNIHQIRGFGLGLSYVKAIVEKHGGTINVESELKKGTKLTIFLPFE
ncbi:MAG TPA: HAMP domain-containing sensor histidine kinase [Bacteroidales bacterium]|nr:HAMP domain-containing sensor histidine kinase [Bacteroidales bacterium]